MPFCPNSFVTYSFWDLLEILKLCSLSFWANLHPHSSASHCTMSQYIDASRILVRLGVIFLTIIWLLVAAFNSAAARFADILLDQATACLIESDSPTLYSTSRKLMSDFRKAMIIVALSSALFSVFGATLFAHPRWIREGRNALGNFFCIQFFFGVAVLSLDGYILDQMHRFRDVFAILDGRSVFPHCSIIYHGAIGQIVLGGLVVLTSLISLGYLCRVR